MKKETVFFQNGEEGMMGRDVVKFVDGGEEVKRCLSIFSESVSCVGRKEDEY